MKSSWWCNDDANIDFVCYLYIYVYMIIWSHHGGVVMMLILILFTTPYIYIYIYIKSILASSLHHHEYFKLSYIYDNLKSSWWCNDDANIDFVCYPYIYMIIWSHHGGVVMMLILILFTTPYIYIYDNLKSSWWCNDDANIDFVCYPYIYIYIYMYMIIWSHLGGVVIMLILILFPTHIYIYIYIYIL